MGWGLLLGCVGVMLGQFPMEIISISKKFTSEAVIPKVIIMDQANGDANSAEARIGIEHFYAFFFVLKLPVGG